MNKGTPEGTQEEINFVRILNKKNDKSLWETLMLDPVSHYAVKVTEKKYGEINGEKVYPKADVFIAQGKVDEKVISKSDFFLDESMIGILELNPVKHSGISVKRLDSDRYQILKMVPNTFKKIFGNTELGAGASIYCQKAIELKKNNYVIAGWDTTWEKFIQYFSKFNKVSVLNDCNAEDEVRLKIAKEIKSYSSKKIKEEIISDKRKLDFAFKGLGNFEEPYTANYQYIGGKFSEMKYSDFSVTTGSGRSRGDFTIVLKPA